MAFKAFLSVFIGGCRKYIYEIWVDVIFLFFLQKFMKKLNCFDVVKSYKKNETRKIKWMFWYNINKYFFLQNLTLCALEMLFLTYIISHGFDGR